MRGSTETMKYFYRALTLQKGPFAGLELIDCVTRWRSFPGSEFLSGPWTHFTVR